jgi:CRP/FNR family cyclic AMP-dependent transcriptional regulator
VAVIDDADSMLEGDGLSLSLARLLAGRLQVMTTYLVDLKQQYADHEGGLGMIDTVLGSLLRGPGIRSELGSERDPYPED